MIFHCSAHNIFFLLDKSWLLNWQKRHLGRFVNGYPLVLHASAKTSQQVQENNHTTWKVDGATSMYWFSMAPYQATFWEFCHLLSLRCTSPFELLNTLADFFRGCFCYTTLPAKKKQGYLSLAKVPIFATGPSAASRSALEMEPFSLICLKTCQLHELSTLIHHATKNFRWKKKQGSVTVGWFRNPGDHQLIWRIYHF